MGTGTGATEVRAFSKAPALQSEAASPGYAGGQAVPRYTSYPTAPNFTPAVNADIQTKWLQALPAYADLSLYLHVPFCAELCHYCGCNTHATRRQEPVEQYIEDLLTEIANVARLSGAKKGSRIHWGGVTPSIFGTGWRTQCSLATSSSPASNN